MATPSEKLAQALEILQKKQNEKGVAVVRANEFTRTVKERLVNNGFLKEVVKGGIFQLVLRRKTGIVHHGICLFGTLLMCIVITALMMTGVCHRSSL